MGKFKPSDYSIENAIKEAARYQGGIYAGDNYVMKDHGDYIEVHVDADNAKGHISLDIYYDEEGRITKIIPHK
ncbi:hypothetical protein [Hominifimenecus sp. rT4P-3]|uniref:hypothetical protein n=1 Tax=Hominifimenecus sp. rT4P-3 TaxID=3242979 RepID=UPI003DA2AB33